jgi:hypothetical protein
MGYKVTFENGVSVNFESKPTQADIDEAHAHVMKTMPNKDRSSIGAMATEAARSVGNTADTALTLLAAGLRDKLMKPIDPSSKMNFMGADLGGNASPEQIADYKQKMIAHEAEQDALYKNMEERNKARSGMTAANPVQGEMEKFGAGLIGLPSTLAMGPIIPGVSQAADLTEQGVDPTTANVAGVIQGAANIPQMFGPLAKPIAGVLSAPFVGAGADAITKKYLASKGYDKQAGDIDPLSPSARALDLVGATPFGVHQKLTERKLERERLTKEKADIEKRLAAVRDPLTEGASPNAAPWKPTKPGTQLPLDIGQQGIEGQLGHYEAGLPADMYLKRNVAERQFDPETGNDIYTTNQPPQPGQGDMFAGTRPYAPEELPAQAAAARAMLAEAKAAEQAVPYNGPDLATEPIQGSPRPQLGMPAVEPPNPGLADLRAIEREIADLKRQREITRDSIPYEQPYIESNYQAKQRVKEQSQPPSYEAMPTVDALRLRALEDKRVQERLVELEKMKRQIEQESIPYDQGMRVEPNTAAPLKETSSMKVEGLEYDKPNGLNNQLPLNETQQRNVRPDEITTKLANEPTQGKLDFLTADGSGIVKMGNGGHIDWKATANGLRTLVQAGGRMIKVVGRHMDLNEGPHGVMRLSLLDDKDGKRIGEIDLSPKQRFDPIDGKNNPLVSNVHLIPEYRGKGIVSDMYKWIASNIGDLVQNKGSTREGGQRLWASLERSGHAVNGRIVGKRVRGDSPPNLNLLDDYIHPDIREMQQKSRDLEKATWSDPQYAGDVRPQIQEIQNAAIKEGFGKGGMWKQLDFAVKMLEESIKDKSISYKEAQQTAIVLIEKAMDMYKHSTGKDYIPVVTGKGDFPHVDALMDKLKNKNPYDGDGPISMANGGFMSPEFQKKTFDWLSKAVMGNAKNSVEGLKEGGKLYGLDRRSPSEVVSSIDPKTAQDIGLTAKTALNFTDQSGILEAIRNYNGTNQIVKWTHDMLKLTDRTYTMLKEDLLKGTEFISGIRGFESRTFSKDSPVRLLQTAIKENWQDTSKMLTQWFEANRNGVEPSFENPKHKEIYDAWQKVFDYTRIHMNELRAFHGLSPISKAEGFFPGMRMGDYRVLVTDGNNNLVGSFHAPSTYAAEAIKQRLKADPEMKDLIIGDVNHIEKSKYDHSYSDFNALELANKALKDQPDVLAAVERAYADVMKGRNFAGKHSIESKHLMGAMGTEFSKKGTIDALKAFEMYTERSVDYMANLQKKSRYLELTKTLADHPELKDKLKNTLQLTKDMVDNSTTSLKNQLEIADNILNFAGRLSGLGEQGFRTKLRQASSLASIYLLSTTSNVASQMVQFVSGSAGLIISNGGGLIGAPKAVSNIFNGLHQTIFPSKDNIAAVNWASKHGYISSDYAELFGARHAEGDFKPIAALQKAYSKVGQSLEKQAVRIPYYLMQIDALKGQYKGEALFEAAAERTDHYMVNYSPGNQAMVWQRLGAVGENAKVLKQFSNNFLGQLGEYIREAKHGDPTPLVVMMVSSIAVAGLAGNIVTQTVDDLIRGINALGAAMKFNWNFPTMQEMLMKSGQSDFLTFGLGSTILGRDISSSVAQNSVKSMLSIPVLDLSIDAAQKVIPYMLKAIEGKDTTEDRALATLAVAPPAFRESLKDIWVKNGVLPDFKHNMEMIYQRTKEEDDAWISRSLIGRPSLNEARKANIIHYTREALAENLADRKSWANVIADKVLDGKLPTDQEMEAWVKEGGDPNNLDDLIKNRIMGKTFDLIDRQYMKKGIGGEASREAIKEEAKASKNIHQQSLSDDKSDARGNVGAALPWNRFDWDNAPDVKEIVSPPIRGAEKRRFFYDTPTERIKRHQELIGAI